MRTADILILVGGGILVVGVLLRYVPGAFSWFGNLPGDIRVEGENSTVFIPITSMILISVILSVILTLAARLFR